MPTTLEALQHRVQDAQTSTQADTLVQDVFSHYQTVFQPFDEQSSQLPEHVNYIQDFLQAVVDGRKWSLVETALKDTFADQESEMINEFFSDLEEMAEACSIMDVVEKDAAYRIEFFTIPMCLSAQDAHASERALQNLKTTAIKEYFESPDMQQSMFHLQANTRESLEIFPVLLSDTLFPCEDPEFMRTAFDAYLRDRKDGQDVLFTDRLKKYQKRTAAPNANIIFGFFLGVMILDLNEHTFYEKRALYEKQAESSSFMNEPAFQQLDSLLVTGSDVTVTSPTNWMPIPVRSTLEVLEDFENAIEHALAERRAIEYQPLTNTTS